ncbi:MAG: sulfur carrier protein ThiS [Phycisphaerales bacterium]|nr:sulfur carrier protein ThiS [Phycisphaerales bacterium]
MPLFDHAGNRVECLLRSTRVFALGAAARSGQRGQRERNNEWCSHEILHCANLTTLMQITVNGKLETLAVHSTVEEVVVRFRTSEVPCAVEVNARLVPHSKRTQVEVRDGDRIEIVTLVGGG